MRYLSHSVYGILKVATQADWDFWMRALLHILALWIPGCRSHNLQLPTRERQEHLEDRQDLQTLTTRLMFTSCLLPIQVCFGFYPTLACKSDFWPD